MIVQSLVARLPPIPPHGITSHLDAMRILSQPAQDAISQRRIADLFVPARDRYLRGEDRRTHMVAPVPASALKKPERAALRIASPNPSALWRLSGVDGLISEVPGFQRGTPVPDFSAVNGLWSPAGEQPHKRLAEPHSLRNWDSRSSRQRQIPYTIFLGRKAVVPVRPHVQIDVGQNPEELCRAKEMPQDQE